MRLSEIFCDNMIFQKGKPIRVYGESCGEVTATLNGNTAKANPKNGRFVAELPPMSYGGPYELEVCGDGEKVTIQNVYVGEVILCSGQSNMEFTMKDETTPSEEYISDDLLRLFVSHKDSENVFEWRICDTRTVDLWSALCYHIGCGLRKKLGCAVGMINASVGASMIQSWMHEDRYYGSEIELPTEKLHIDFSYPLYDWNNPGDLYHRVLERLLPYSVRSVVWYQGESNTSDAESEIYGKMLEILTSCWREAFRDGTLPFTVVQIANYKQSSNPKAWSRLQQAQSDAARTIPHLTCVESFDLCEDDNIHPPTKYRLAHRICEDLIGKGLFTQ